MECFGAVRAFSGSAPWRLISCVVLLVAQPCKATRVNHPEAAKAGYLPQYSGLGIHARMHRCAQWTCLRIGPKMGGFPFDNLRRATFPEPSLRAACAACTEPSAPRIVVWVWSGCKKSAWIGKKEMEVQQANSRAHHGIVIQNESRAWQGTLSPRDYAKRYLCFFITKRQNKESNQRHITKNADTRTTARFPPTGGFCLRRKDLLGILISIKFIALKIIANCIV